MSVSAVLKEADIFYELSDTHLELIASICDEKHFKAGSVIFEANTPGDELYVIAGGEVEIQINPAHIDEQSNGEHAQTIATLRRGQSFGEVSLVDHGSRSAKARCAQTEDTRLIVIPRDKLTLLCDTYPQMGYRLMRNLAADLAMKIRHTDLQVREFLTWAHRVEE